MGKQVEDSRRDRERRIEAGDESACLKIPVDDSDRSKGSGKGKRKGKNRRGKDNENNNGKEVAREKAEVQQGRKRPERSDPPARADIAKKKLGARATRWVARKMDTRSDANRERARERTFAKPERAERPVRPRTDIRPERSGKMGLGRFASSKSSGKGARVRSRISALARPMLRRDARPMRQERPVGDSGRANSFRETRRPPPPSRQIGRD